MKPNNLIFKNTFLQIVVFLSAIALIGNLNAVVDSFLHPEIPYFDKEHLIVGGITGFVTAVLCGLIILYTRHLERSLSKIVVLESFLPICSSCKKIRISGSDPFKAESWQSLETYIKERLDTEFTHSICPDCVKKLYPGFEK